jgi:hypothetical protein
MLLAIAGSLAGVVVFVFLLISMSFIPFDNPFFKVVIGSLSSAAAFWVAISIANFPLHWAASGFIALNVLAGAARSRNIYIWASTAVTTIMILVKMYS